MFEYTLLFIIGAVTGSFLNVAAMRWGRQNIRGRSKCPHCGKTLSWYELIPLVSFLIQRARCRECNANISYQYPLVEIFTGLVFVSIFTLSFSSFLESVILLDVFCIYIVILIYDIHHKIIPDDLVYTAIILSGVYLLFFTNYSTLDLAAGPIIFAFFATVWLLSGGRAMGFGDAKLGLSVGALLGASIGFSAIIFSFWIGAAFSLIYILLKRISFLKSTAGLTMKSEIPFAPFIIIGTWISLVFNLDLFHVLLF